MPRNFSPRVGDPKLNEAPARVFSSALHSRGGMGLLRGGLKDTLWRVQVAFLASAWRMGAGTIFLY